MEKNHIAAVLIVNIIAYPILAHTQYWGEERYAHSVTNIRADRTTESKIVGQLMPGQKIRTDFLEKNWFAIFGLEETVSDERKALGYVYAPLLTPDPPASNKPSVKSSSMLNYKVVLKEHTSYLGRSCMALRVVVNEQRVPSVTSLLITAIEIWENGNKEQQTFVVFIYLSDLDSVKDAYAVIEFSPNGWERLMINPKALEGTKPYNDIVLSAEP
ncbi:MAG: hypothetical protein V3R78_08225 [Thermodesulfobacteriota bacterium]